MMKTPLSFFSRILAVATLLGAVSAPAWSAVSASPAPINVATYNLRYNNTGDGPNAWPNRRDTVKALVRYHEFDILGTQEGLADQIADLGQMEEFDHVGVGRDDGKDAGEHSAIFYRKSRFTLLGKGDFWLSETPDRPSLGWDARCCKRIASWARLRDRSSARTFYVFSVHFDHEGEVARRNSADLMLRKIAEITHGEPVICVGDFNSTPDTVQIQKMSATLRDASRVSKAPPYGPTATYNGFHIDKAPTDRIDYIFVDQRFDVLKYAVLTDSVEGRYPSDHDPVVARVVLK